MAEVKKTDRRAAYFDSSAPGVYLEEEFRLPRRALFTTGVPAFLGRMPEAPGKIKPYVPRMLTLWSQFKEHIGPPSANPNLAHAVRGFFENGGRGCYVVVFEDRTERGLNACLEALGELNTVDLVCAPDLPENREKAFSFQQTIVWHCEKLGDRFALLDSRRGDDLDNVWEQWSEINGKDGALYYPWIKVPGFAGRVELVPPCGHIAGMIARTDRNRGVHKAPANEVLEGVVGLERILTDSEQDYLNPRRVNCIRSFPGRGIRVWGARTLSGEPAWTYVNARRLFLTAIRWIDWHMLEVAFESNDHTLWARIERELNTYFMDQYRLGALKGNTPEEAFYVKCDAETNPPEVRELNQVVTEIGLAPAIPYEFVIVRLIHGPSGVRISGPAAPQQH